MLILSKGQLVRAQSARVVFAVVILAVKAILVWVDGVGRVVLEGDLTVDLVGHGGI